MAYDPRNQYGPFQRPNYSQQPPPQAQKPPPQAQAQSQYNGYAHNGYYEEEPRPYSYKGYDGDGFWEEYGYSENLQYQHGPHDQFPGQKPPSRGGYPGGQNTQQYSQDPRQQYHPQGRPRGYSNGASGPPPNGRMPPNAHRTPPQNYGTRGRPPPNGNYAHQAQQQRGQQQGTSPHQRQVRDQLLSSTSPTTLNFDNPFPVFPAQQPKARTDQGYVNEAMGNIDLNRRPSYDSQRPRTAGSRSSNKSSGSGHYNDGYGGAARRPSLGRAGRPSFDDPAARGPPKRSVTMPENSGYSASNQHSQPMPNTVQGFGYGRGTPGGGYTDPGLQRSFTGVNSRQEPQFVPPQRSYTTAGDRPAQQQQQVSGPYNGSYGSQVNMQGRAPGGHPVMRDGPSPPQQRQLNWRESQLDEYMPNFDDSTDTPASIVDPVGLPLDNAPGIQRPPTRAGSNTPSSRAPELSQSGQGFQRSRSQPDLRSHAANQVYQSGPDAPPMPRGTSPMSTGGFSQHSSPVYGNTVYGQPPQPQPQYAIQHPGSYGHGQPQSPTARQFHRPGAPPMPQFARMDTAQSTLSDPGSAAGQRVDPRPPPMRPGQMGQPAQMQGSQQQPLNPDALPAHPAPVRPGLTQGTQSSQIGRPAPVRQYGNAPPQQAGPPMDSVRPSVDQQRPLSGPITYDELSKLKQVVKNSPSDNKARLLLAKKLIEASVVLADENGRADVKTRTKNRENYILEASKLIKKLCSSQYPDAMFFLADCHGTGQMGLAVDQKEAFQLYQQAAKLGHAAAAYRTAVCCEMGSDAGGGTRRDPLKAVQWYRRAATLGDVPAMYKLGMIVLKGLLGQQPSVGEAVIWLERAAERANEENPHALHELAIIYETAPNGSKIIRDEAYALQLVEKAARFGYRLSQCRLGKAYEYGQLGCPIDNRSSIHWYSKAAAQEDHEAELALSGWYLTGCATILEQSDAEAYLWARKAAMSEMPKAEFAMGYFSEVGIGCPRSLDDAKRWYGRAAAHKFPKAQERLEELKRGGVKAQRDRERLSRSDRQKNNDECVVM